MLPNHYAISLQNGPHDRATLEFHSDAVAIIRQFLGVNHLPADRIIVQRSNLYRVARSPEVFREYAGAVWTDVIRERPLLSNGAPRFTPREAHHDNDREPLFRSATCLVVQSVLAWTLTG